MRRPAVLIVAGQKNHRELIDAEFAINLDGTSGVLKDDDRFYFRFFTSEKTYVTYTIETTSPGGHGSLPGPDNAIYRLANGLGRLANIATTRIYDRRKMKPEDSPTFKVSY